MADIIIKRVGGKYKITDWIIGLLPHHNIYCDVFGGSFSVGLSIEKKSNTNYRKVYNDIDCHASNLFTVLRDNYEILASKIENTPYSRKDFEDACDLLENIKDFSNIDKIEWARQYIIFNRQSIFGKEDKHWCIARKGENNCMTWHSVPELIKIVGQKLKETYIECDDYSNVIDRWDSEETLFYCDVPYIGVETDFYRPNKGHGFDHGLFAKKIKSVKGSWAISYYDSAIVRELYSGYDFYTKDVKKNMQTKKKKDSEIELLIVKRNEWSKINQENDCFSM